MKRCFLLLMFFVLIVIRTVDAQETSIKHNWVEIEAPAGMNGQFFIDYSFIVMPNKNVKYWFKMILPPFTETDLIEVNCFKRKYIYLESTEFDADRHEVKTLGKSEWKPVDNSFEGTLANMVCKLQAKRSTSVKRRS